MTAVERIYELVKAMPTEQVHEVLDFAEFLHQKQANQESSGMPTIPLGTLTGLRGIAKRAGQNLSDEQLQSDYTDYLAQKYQ